MNVIDDDIDVDNMTDDEVVAYLMRRCDITREQAMQNWQEACSEVRAATGVLFAAIVGGKIEATGINIETGKREVIPPHKFARIRHGR